MTIAGYLNKVQRLDTDRAIDSGLEATQKEVIRLNQEQMIHGINKEGNKIGRYRNPAYAAKKIAMNPLAGGFVDLKLTGDFYREMFTDLRRDIIVIGSTDSKALSLLKRYPSVFGLTPQSKEAYSKILRPFILSNIKKQLNGR